jgi:cell division septation protein DedD
MDMARKSVRRRPASPFGNRWITGGALAGVVGLSVMLILTESRHPDVTAPGKEAVAPLSESVTDAMKGPAQMLDSPLELSRQREEKRELPVAPQPRLRSFSGLHDTEEIKPDRATGITAEPASRAAPAPSEEALYLLAGSFHNRQHADALQARLTGLGFRCEIQELSTSDAQSVHRIRVGPFTDLRALEKARRELDELGFDTQDSVNPKPSPAP